MQISDHIFAIRIPFSIPLPSGQKVQRLVYAYLVIGEKIALIDTGVAGAESTIFAYLKNLGKRPEDISQILFTHAHPDHIGAAKAIRQQCSCSTAAHVKAQAWIEDVLRQFAERPVPGFHTLVGGSVLVDRILNDNEEFDLGGVPFTIFHTPGHSQDSLSLFCPADSVLVSGDTVPHSGELPIYEDLDASVQSITRLLHTKDLKTLLSSWCTPDLNADPYRLLEKGLEYLQKIHDQVRSLAGGRTDHDPMELCRKMVEQLDLPDVAVNPLVARSFLAHLNLLHRETLWDRSSNLR